MVEINDLKLHLLFSLNSTVSQQMCFKSFNVPLTYTTVLKALSVLLAFKIEYSPDWIFLENHSLDNKKNFFSFGLRAALLIKP